MTAQAPPEAARSDLDAGENGGSLIEAGVRSLCAECGRVVIVLPGRQHSAYLPQRNEQRP